MDDGDIPGLPKRWGRARAEHSSYTDFYRRSGYSGFQHETRAAGSLGVQLLQVRQDGHGLTDRATPDLLIGIRRRVDRAPARYNLGDGWIDIPTNRPHTVAAPPLTDVDYRIEGPSELIILAAPAQRLASAVDSPPLVERLAPVYERPFEDPMFPLLAGRAWTEADRADGLFVDSVALALLSALLSAADAQRTKTSAPAPPTDLRFTRVIDFIEAHLHEDISLSDLAAAACLSPFHFTRAFRARHGVSPVRFVQRRRIERSMRLLLQPGSRIAAVAHACGFADQAHFTTAFRRLTGTTPGAWRAARTA
jgi:AraC family transcriptional regulator